MKGLTSVSIVESETLFSSSFVAATVSTLADRMAGSDVNATAVNSPARILTVPSLSVSYSSNETSQRYLDDTTRQILLIDETIFAQPNQVYQVRIPSKDIQVRVKTLTSTSFS